MAAKTKAEAFAGFLEEHGFAVQQSEGGGYRLGEQFDVIRYVRVWGVRGDVRLEASWSRLVDGPDRWALEHALAFVRHADRSVERFATLMGTVGTVSREREQRAQCPWVRMRGVSSLMRLAEMQAGACESWVRSRAGRS